MASHFLLGDSSFRFRLDGHPSKKQPPRGAKRLVQVPDKRRDLVGRFVECEMPRFQDVDFCSRHSSA